MGTGCIGFFAGCSGDSPGGSGTTPGQGGETTTDGEGIFATQPALNSEGFEDSEMGLWDIAAEEWGRSTEYQNTGEYSAGLTKGGPDTRDFISTIATASPANLDGGVRISEFTYHWLELESSFGGGVRLFNSDGNLEVGVASNNPSWIIDAGTENEVTADGYRRWIETSLSFNWGDGTVSVGFVDTETGTTHSGEYSLKQGADVETIEISAYTGARGWKSESCHMYWDDIAVVE